MEWIICTSKRAHRLELVAKDIRLDRLGVDVKFISVPWYAQTPEDIVAIYAYCNNGKQYEELFKTARHLGMRWYARIKFRETRFI
jgi:hypothetical protein